MPIAQLARTREFADEIRNLFYQRTLICLWLAVVFFSLFSFLDAVCCKENFRLFLMFRSAYVVTLVCFINLLAIPSFKQYAPHFIYTAMALGGFTISLMTVQLGGFYSGYYVGILLMIAGALSVLPLRVTQVLAVGGSMYLIYVLTVLVGTADVERAHLVAMMNNSFFFLALVGVTAVQSYDDLQTLLKSLGTTRNLQGIRAKLTDYRGDLEGLVQQRLEELEESDLKYRDLYDSILDLVVLIDTRGRIKKINSHSVVLLGLEPAELQGSFLADFIRVKQGGREFIANVIADLHEGGQVRGVQLQLKNISEKIIEAELSASRVALESGFFYQFVIRDISSTKQVERMLLDSERLLDTSRQAAIFGLAKLAECRDDDTGAHLNRIRDYTRLVVEDLASQPGYEREIDEQFVEDIFRSSVLHDIGKVGIPDSILLKPGRLTREEFDIMKAHCRYGSDILAGAEDNDNEVTFLLLARDIACHHHERWDGNGYPDGLVGTAIPLAARIVSLADVYDALTSTRVYKAAYSHDEARGLITKESAGQFDPNIVDAFVRREAEFKECRMQFLLQESKRTPP
ncbi:HD domain-containing phosphohydrolase [Desulfopila sp. IMCC35008]|uniref:HD domain-containing phosphohydrolase n=1 Tax=Desulfopila sp. IMCC35008 TaxID=2653858 RepID=UPI0013D0DDBF|nr:HD domain-containing phosphohydrolase [Desulfopila sp. IMCC35008]